MSDTLDKMRLMIFETYNSLPVILLICMFTFGVGLGNYGMISIFIGQVTLAGVVWLLRKLGGQVSSEFHSSVPGVIFNSGSNPSMWITQVSFFMSCMIANAATLLQRAEAPSGGSDPAIATKVYRRKSRCIMVITMSSILLVALIIYRIFAERSSNDNIGWSLIRSLFPLAIGGVGAYVWWWASNLPTIGVQNMDIFGISQQLIQVRNTDIMTMCQLVQ